MGVNFLKLAASAFILAWPGSSLAGADVSQPRAVVELFTSQGCNSCPPADEFFSELAAAGDVVALSYHVDYWDYLGWRDTLASADNTARQHEYNRSFGNRMVYTPQAIVNGRQQVNGAKRQKVRGAIDRMAGTTEGMSVEVEIAYSGDSVVIETGAADFDVGDAQVVLVYFHPPTKVDIDRGKNNGLSFVYVNSVSSFHTVGKWHGREARFELPMSEIARKGAGGCAVLVQEMRKGGLPGPILGAALINMPSGW